MTEQQAFDAAHLAYPELQKPDIAVTLNMPDHPNWVVWYHDWPDQMIITDGNTANLFKLTKRRDVPTRGTK